MEKPPIKMNTNHIFGLYLFFAIGVLLHLIPTTRQLAILITPFTLLGINGIAVWQGLKQIEQNYRSKLLAWIVVVYIITLIAEILGVASGLIFGEYSYGSVLGPQLLGAPVIIGLNWVIVTWGALTIAARLSQGWSAIILGSALLTVIFDWVMEPVAIKLGYWQWDQGVIPIQNYLAWLVLTIVAGIVAKLIIHKSEFLNNSLLTHVFSAQLVFFALLNLFLN